MPAERPIDQRQVEQLLLSAPLDRPTRQQAWAAFFASETQDEFNEQFRGLPVPRETFQQLWKLRWGQPAETGLLLAPVPGTRPATPVLKGEERAFVPPTGRELARFGIETLPFLTSAGATLLALPETVATGGTVAALGAVPGEALRQKLLEKYGFEKPMTPEEVIGGLTTTATEYAVGEAAPRAVGGILTGLAGGPLRRGATMPANIAAKEASERWDLSLTPGQVAKGTKGGTLARSAEFIAETSLLGRPKVEATRSAGLRHALKAVDETLGTLSQPISPQTVGIRGQNAIDVGNRIFHEYAGRLYGDVDRLAGQALVDMTPVKQAAQKELSEWLREAGIGPTGALAPPSGVAIQYPRLGQPTPKQAMILNDIALGPDTLTFQEAQKLRTQLLGVGFDPSELLPKGAKATARHMTGNLTDAMDQAAAALSPEAREAWNTARTFWRDGHEVFERSLVKTLYDANPERFVGSVKTVSDAQATRRALLEYAERYGTQAEKDTARQTWREFQENWARTHLLRDPEAAGLEVADLYNLKKRMQGAGKSALNAIYGGDAAGQEALANLGRIGEAMNRVKAELPFTRTYQIAELIRLTAAVTTGAVVGASAGARTGIVTAAGMEIAPYLLAKVTYSKVATEYLLNGISAFAKRAPFIPAAWRPALARGTQQATDAARAYVPDAFGFFGRAFVTALLEEEGQARERLKERERQALRQGTGRPRPIAPPTIISPAQPVMGLGGVYEPLAPVPAVPNPTGEGVQDDLQVVESILTGAVAAKEVKGAAWRAYFSSQTPTEFQAAFDAVPLPQPVKAALFDYRFNGIAPAGIKAAAEPTGRAAEAGWLQRPLVDIEPLAPVPSVGETPYGKFRGGMVRGLARGVSSLTTPENVGLLGTMRAAPKVLGAAVGGAAATAAGLYFSAQMALNLINSIPAAKEAWDKGDYAALGQIVGEDVVAAALLTHGGRETRPAGKPALAEVPQAPRPGPIRVLESEIRPPRIAVEELPPSARGPAEPIEVRVPIARRRIVTPRSRPTPIAGASPPISLARPLGPPGTERLAPSAGLAEIPTRIAIPELARGTAAEAPEILRPVPGGRTPLAPNYQGSETAVLIPGKADRYAVVYEVRELPDVFASHNPFTFQRQPPEYYWHRNPRDYDNPANQERIVLDSSPGRFQPERLVTDNPDAVNGPPIIDEAGNVLGGNSRVMKLTRAYSGQPGTDAAGAAAYKAMLAQNAGRFGLDPAVISGMETPILVRRLVKPLRADEAAKAVIDLNLDPQAAMTPAERAVADARRTPMEAVEYLQRAIEEAGPEATLNEALTGPKGARIINELVAQGVFTAQEKPNLVDAKTGALTGAAKERISKLMLGRLFRDSDQLERTPPETKAKLERIVAPVARLQGQPEWDIMPRVQEAIDLLEYARATGLKNLDDVTRQQAMFGTPDWTPEGVAIAKKLGEKPTDVVRAFRQYAGEAEMAAQGEMMFGTPTPAESFASAFAPKTEALPPVPGTQGKAAAPPQPKPRRGYRKRLPNPR